MELTNCTASALFCCSSTDRMIKATGRPGGDGDNVTMTVVKVVIVRVIGRTFYGPSELWQCISVD